MMTEEKREIQENLQDKQKWIESFTDHRLPLCNTVLTFGKLAEFLRDTVDKREKQERVAHEIFTMFDAT